MKGQKTRLPLLLAAGVIGGILGGLLLLHTSERLFRAIVPYLILLASGLLATQNRVRTWLSRRSSRSASPSGFKLLTAFPVCLAAVYGGYFGAGLSVIVLAVLGLTMEDSLTRLNACKQAIAFAANSGVAILFLFSNRVVWSMVLVMAAGALLGGAMGGRIASRIKPEALRWTVVSLGTIVAVIYLLP